jgi:hypothetical protein
MTAAIAQPQPNTGQRRRGRPAKGTQAAVPFDTTQQQQQMEGMQHPSSGTSATTTQQRGVRRNRRTASTRNRASGSTGQTGTLAGQQGGKLALGYAALFGGITKALSYGLTANDIKACSSNIQWGVSGIS